MRDDTERDQPETVRQEGDPKGNYLKIDTTAVMHIDVFDIAEKIDKLIASGMYCVDELRQKLGDAELGTEESQMHFITKNYTELSEVSMKGDTG